MTQTEAALKFVNSVKREAKLRGRPRTSLPKAPLTSDPVTVALQIPSQDLTGAILDAPKTVQRFIESFRAGKHPDLVAAS